MTMKCTHHMEDEEISHREWVEEGSLEVCHVRGCINPVDIYTKEMKDGAHFLCLRDSFLCRAAGFSRSLMTRPTSTPHLPLSASWSSILQTPSLPGLLEVIATCRELHRRHHILHLSSAGCQYAQAAFLAFR
ncbi:hypothetical protein ACHAWF_002281 [Thalassiosira exigua]